jgi:flagellar hook-associated protein 3 FlgL
MRISNKQIHETVRTAVSKASSALAKAQETAITGKKLVHPSDDPSGAAMANAIRSAVAANDAYTRNASRAKELLTATEAALSDIMSVLQEARQLAMQTNNETITPEGRAALVAHVQSLQKRLRLIANTSADGIYVFGGAQTEEPYPETSNPVPSYKGDLGERLIEIGPNTVVAGNVPGTKVFNVQVEDKPTNLFAILEELSDGVKSAVEPSDLLKQIDKALENVLAVRTEIGGRLQRVELATSRLSDAEINLKTSLSKLEDADLSEAILELKQRELAYEAALAVASRVGNLSLLDYLR